MRAIVKGWGGWFGLVTCKPRLSNFLEYVCTTNEITFMADISEIEIINEDEWDAEIYALLLIESQVIYE